jgi:Family of unknown function (DUF6622)
MIRRRFVGDPEPTRTTRNPRERPDTRASDPEPTRKKATSHAMETIVQILAHTPWWVFLLFAFLVSRGIRAFSPAEVSLAQLAIVPGIFTIWGLAGLNARHGLSPGAFAVWLTALAIGAIIGAAILDGTALRGDRTRGVIHRPADFTVLPLILIAFGGKYALAVTVATSPEIAREVGFRLVDLGVSGLFTGAFVGKFTRYARAYLMS